MQKFIKNTLTFSAAAILIIALLTLLPLYIVKKKVKLVINKNATIVLFGHSHPECAFNDTLIGNFKNLAHSAEPYFYNYQKVKLVLTQNPQIETVLIDFSNNEIDEKMNTWTWGYEYMSNMFPKFAPYMDETDISLLIKNNPKDFFSCLSIASRKNLIRIITNDYDVRSEMGGYLRLNHTESTRPGANGGDEANTSSQPGHVISSVNILYLQKIVAFCRQMHKRVYFVRSPQNKKFEYLKNERDFVRIKNTDFPSVELLDFNNFPLPDSDFADFGHLNYRGASKFSRWFNKLLNAGLLANKDKQDFIDKSISALKLKQNSQQFYALKED